MVYFNIFVYGHPTSCFNILASLAPLVSRLLKHDLVLSTVLRNVYSLVWSSGKTSFLVSK